MTDRIQLTKNFYKHEFERSEAAARNGIDNTIPEALMPNVRRIAEVMQKIRGALGGRPITVSSGYRSPALNAVLPGSSKTSAHMQGLACDFIVFGMSPAAVCRTLAPLVDELGIDQLILEYNQWTHVGLRVATESPRKQVFSYVRRNGEVVRLAGVVEK